MESSKLIRAYTFAKVIVAVPPYLQFCFLEFQLPAVNYGLKILTGKFQK